MVRLTLLEQESHKLYEINDLPDWTDGQDLELPSGLRSCNSDE